jgi:cyclophilin family peptidyl-prolyl cis-trans isomerase
MAMKAFTKPFYLPLLAALVVSACAKNGTDSSINQDVAIPGVDPDRPQVSEAGRVQEEVAIGDYPKVELLTSQGRIVIALYTDKAPATTRNFLSYVESKHYDNTVFHRVVNNLLIQGGSYTPDYRFKPDGKFTPSESNNGLRNKRGTVAIARRLNDANAAGAQFFINLVDNPQFDFVSATDASTRGYTVFGQVIEGMDIVDGMRSVPTNAREGISEAVPVKPLIIKQALTLE